MLQFIISRAGGGKTTKIMELIRDFLKGGQNLLTLIVPEQNSFQCEKDVLSMVGAPAMTDIDVTSFTALSESLLGKPAHYGRRRLSESASTVLMSMAMYEIKDELKLYGKHTGRKSLIMSFSSLSSELKQNCITIEDLNAAADGMPGGLLKEKLSDISRIMETYDRKVKESYFDPNDMLTELCSTSAIEEYFSNRIVFIDSFRGFSAQEYKVISQILRYAKAVYVTLCADNIDPVPEDVTNLFAPTRRTADTLRRLAKECGCSVDSVLNLSSGGKYNNFPPRFERYSCPELYALEHLIYSDTEITYDDEAENITLFTGEDIYSECDFVAATAKKLIRESNYRCRDITIVAREMSSYEAPLRSALKKYGISIFEDSRRPVDVSPVINIISAALSIAANGFSTEDLMRYLKTGLAGLTTDEISEVENYAYIWQISGKKWTEEWTSNPSGFVAFTESDTEHLKTINSIREKIMTPLVRFRQKLRGGKDGTEAVTALWNLIEEINLQENIKSMAEVLYKSGEDGIVTELERMWVLLVNVMDELETLTRGQKVTSSRLSDTLELMLSVQTIGNLPQGLDEIIIGSADRIRFSSPKAVFILGANEGVFPASPSVSSTLTEKEKAVMENFGIKFFGSNEWRVAEEKLIAYSCISAARDKVYISCSEKNIRGEMINPGEFWTDIDRTFTKCSRMTYSDLDGLYFAEADQPAFEQLAKSQPGILKSTFTEYFEGKPDYSDRLHALERAAGSRDFTIGNTQTAEKLFGKDMNVSASKVDTFYKCAFSYFCKYGLKAKPRRIAELDPAARGNVIHSVMENLLREHPADELMSIEKDELYDIVNTLTDSYLEAVLEGTEPDERFLETYEKLKETICLVAERLIEEFSRSEFRPVDFELKIGTDGQIPSYRLNCTKGTVNIEGSVDRVDIAEIDGETYFRVVDYKSSGKCFRLSDVLQGLNMQMFIYLFSIWENGTGKYGNVTPAGVLYSNISSPYIPMNRDSSEEDIKKALVKKVKMTGLVLDDSRIICAMENDGKGVFIPASVKKGEPDGNIIGIKSLEKLKEKADFLLINMADMLNGGQIKPLPVYSDSSDSAYKDACTYCDYKAICGYEEEIARKRLNDMKYDEALAELEGKEEND